MKYHRQKALAWFLAGAIVASPGCATGAMTIANPTRGSVEGRVRPGDQVELVMKSGERRKVEVAGVQPDELWVGCDAKVAYGDIQEVQVPGKKVSFGINSGGGSFNFGNCDGRAVVVIVAVVIVAAAVVWGLSELDKARRRW